MKGAPDTGSGDASEGDWEIWPGFSLLTTIRQWQEGNDEEDEEEALQHWHRALATRFLRWNAVELQPCHILADPFRGCRSSEPKYCHKVSTPRLQSPSFCTTRYREDVSGPAYLSIEVQTLTSTGSVGGTGATRKTS